MVASVFEWVAHCWGAFAVEAEGVVFHWRIEAFFSKVVVKEKGDLSYLLAIVLEEEDALVLVLHDQVERVA